MATDVQAKNLPSDLVINDDTIFIISDPVTNIAYKVSALELRQGYFKNYVFFKNFLLGDIVFEQITTTPYDTQPTVSTLTNTSLNFDYFQWTTTDTNAEVTFKLFADFEADFTPIPGFVHLDFNGGFSTVIRSGTDVELKFILQKYSGTSTTPANSDFTDITTRVSEYYVPASIDHEIPADLLSSPIEVEAGSLPWESGDILRGLIKIKILDPIDSFANDPIAVSRTNSQVALKTFSFEFYQPII